MTVDDRTPHLMKPISKRGVRELDASRLGLGYVCRKGLKPSIPNQDSWIILKALGEFSIYAVCDGHGMHGHTISDYVKENLTKYIVTDKRFRTAKMPDML